MGYDKRETLCITCMKLCKGACSWSDHFEPLSGWTAIENRQGYLVVECPEYVNDEDGSGKLKEIDKDGMMRLLEAAAAQMREDYVSGYGPYNNHENYKRGDKMTRAQVRTANRRAIEMWLLKGGGAKLLQLTNPEEVIDMLRVLARRHDTELAKMGV